MVVIENEDNDDDEDERVVVAVVGTVCKVMFSPHVISNANNGGGVSVVLTCQVFRCDGNEAEPRVWKHMVRIKPSVFSCMSKGQACPKVKGPVIKNGAPTTSGEEYEAAFPFPVRACTASSVTPLEMPSFHFSGLGLHSFSLPVILC